MPRALGYKVMIAEGSPAVMKIILGGHVDAVLGVACLDALERTLDKVLLAGIPCMAVPLVEAGCRNTSADADWIRAMVDTPHRPHAIETRTYLHLMRRGRPDVRARRIRAALSPRCAAGRTWPRRTATGLAALDPIACTEAIAYDFLIAGGKHSRPFITLAVYDALRGGHATLSDGAAQSPRFPTPSAAWRWRSRSSTKPRWCMTTWKTTTPSATAARRCTSKFGQATAINVGDYLIGLGYRLVADLAREAGPDVAADILGIFASAHTRLCEGQGAELVWRDARDKRLTPLDALRIYALKTSPAFEAAILAGVRLAGPIDALSRGHRPLRAASGGGLPDDQRSRRLADRRARRRAIAAPILLGGRPTVLWALALESLCDAARQELEHLPKAELSANERIARAAALYHEAEVFRKVSRVGRQTSSAGGRGGR